MFQNAFVLGILVGCGGLSIAIYGLGSALVKLRAVVTITLGL